MAFSKIILAVSALATISAAVPLHLPRDYSPVVTETAYTTVDVPVTLWVDEHGKPIRTEAQGGQFAEQTHSLEMSTSTSTSSAMIVSTTSPGAAAVVPTTSPVPAVFAPSSPTTSSAYVAPTTSAPAYQAPAPSSAPVASSSSPAPAAPVPSPAATNAASSGQDVTGSSSASCEGTSNACSGDITHWDGGLGACGWNVNTNSDMQIALPYGFMGTQSNGNPYCGRSLTIKNPTTGQTVQATVGDKCMGCTGRSIDMTNALFDAIGNGCDGRCSGFDWWFN